MAEAKKEVKEEKKEVKEEKKEVKKKETKPKLLKISELCFAAAEKERLFPKGKEDLAAEIVSTLKEARQTVNIKGKVITKENVASQVSAWMGDIKNQRQGRWSKVEFVDDKAGLQFKRRA